MSRFSANEIQQVGSASATTCMLDECLRRPICLACNIEQEQNVPIYLLFCIFRPFQGVLLQGFD